MQLNNVCATVLIVGVYVANEMIRRAYPEEVLQLNAVVAVVAMPIIVTYGLIELGRKIANALPPIPEGFRQFPAGMRRLVEDGVI